MMICSEETFDDLRAFSDATGMVIAFQPAEGQSVCGAAEHGAGVFCRMVSSQLGGQVPCRTALRRSIQAAANSRKPVSVQCFAGLRHTVVPVFRGVFFAGSLLIGQTTDRPHNVKRLASLGKKLRALGLDNGVKALLKAYSKVPVGKAIQFDAAVKLASAMAVHLAETLVPDEFPPGTQARCVRGMMAFAGLHFTKSCGLRDAAKHLDCSASYAGRVFHSQTGRAFTQHVTSLRVGHARDLLSKNHMSVIDLALASGFGSLFQFNRAFKKETGVTPTAWRLRF
jgi:AraC-like DNA-binding protein/ligand-binding sensor protein